MDRRVDGVHSVVGILDHHVAGVVDDVGVVALAAGHPVRAGAAVERVLFVSWKRLAGDSMCRVDQVVNRSTNDADTHDIFNLNRDSLSVHATNAV